jgi:hypothetical protein
MYRALGLLALALGLLQFILRFFEIRARIPQL